jgi:Protein of unknown function (DUF4058)
MPLRDHFRPPVSEQSSWEGFHGYWPAAIVQALADQLPPGYVAEPRVHLGAFYEIDVCTFERADPLTPAGRTPASTGGVAVAPAPTFSIEAEMPEQYEYEVLVYDTQHGRRLVAAMEIVSPANKDRPENRQLFVAKCAELLRKGVCVSIVDLVTVRHANLYVDLLKLIGCTDPAFAADPSSIYAATCRKRVVNRKTRFEMWSHLLAIGASLPTLPIWLNEDVSLLVDLEASYEQTCRILRIP